MSKKVINLGKVKGRTLDLKVEDKIIKKKYDDETEWQPLVDLGEAGSSIDTVSGYSELPTDAKENDVAIVEKEEYLRTENKTVVLPIEVKLNTEDQYIPNIYSINFRDSFNSIVDNEEIKNLGSALNIMLETETRSIMYADIGADAAPMMAGVDHPAQVVAVMNSEEDMSFYVSGISIRDFLQLMMELELEEEQWAILLGSHANDSSADSPSYGWINLVTSNEPINENSLEFDGFYGTLLFDSEAPKITDILGYASVNIINPSGEGIEASTSLYSTYESGSDVDPEEQAFVLKFVNLALNNIAHGGMFEQNKDIYNPKGLFQNDNGEWVSLEEKMNTPRFVDTYADLPKTSIENGIMAVAKESVYRSEPELTTKLEMMKKYRINSVGDMTVETFNSIIEDLLPGYPTMGYIDSGLWFMSLSGDQEMSMMIMRSPFSATENICGIQMSVWDYETNQEKRAICLVELPIDFDTSEMFPPEQGSNEPLEFSPEIGEWYWCDIGYDDHEGREYSIGGIHEGFPTDLPDELLYYGGEIYWDEELYPASVSEVSTYDSDPTNRKDITSIDFKVFNFEDLSSSISITYPAGFYRYNDNEWKHVEDVSGGNFENEDALRALTTTDIGNIQENTEKRHEHNNKSYLDQIQWDTVHHINQNTMARHIHNNKTVLDNITDYTISEIGLNSSARHTHNNRSVLDMLSAYEMENIHSNTQARHAHGNKSTLDKITETDLTNIASNTSARHTHSNQSALNSISTTTINDISNNTSARHTHSNKSTLDKVTESKLTDIASNTSARHTHNNKTYLDQISSTTVDNISKNTTARHSHSNKSVLDKITVDSASNELLYDGSPLNNLVSSITAYTSDITLVANKIVSYLGSGPINIVSIPQGTSWLSFALSGATDRKLFEFSFPEMIAWKNGIHPPVGNDKHDMRVFIKFEKNTSNQTFGEWFSEATGLLTGTRIDNRLLPPNINPNFARVENGNIKFLPLMDTTKKYNYTPSNYKRVYGECPYLLTETLTPSDECELKFKEYDDFIIVYWIVTPKGSRVGNYVNSSVIKDWTYLFYGYQGESIYDLMLGKELDTSNGEKFYYTFADCRNLIEVPSMDLSNGTNFICMFFGCYELTTISQLQFDHTKVSDMGGMFQYCSKLQNVTVLGSICINKNTDFLYPTNLTADSLMSFINAFEDNTGEEIQYTVTIGTTKLNKLTPEQIAVATSKNILLI